MIRIFPGDGKIDDDATAKKRGTRIAWVRAKGSEEPIKTIYIKGDDFDEDDDDTTAEGGALGGPDPSNTPNRDDMLPPSFYTGLRNISPFNKELLRKAIRMHNEDILLSARPTRQEVYLHGYFTKAEEELATLESKHFVLSRPVGGGLASDKKRKAEAAVAAAAAAAAEPEIDDTHVVSAPSEKRKKLQQQKADMTVSEAIEVIVPIPMSPAFQTCIFGPTGSGKSYWAATTLMAGYEYFYPDNPIYIWSFFEHDPAYDRCKNAHYIKVDESLLDDPPKLSEFENSLMVFDDIESLPSELREVVTKFRDQCMACGRKPNISVIAIAHEVLNGFTTKSSITECQEIVLFQQGVVEPIEKLMRKKYGMSKDAVNFVVNSKTRWVMIKRSFPQALITPREIKCL